MTEIERLITNTLATIEQELRQKQETQEKTLIEQQKIIINHTIILQHLQQETNHLNVKQQELMHNLQRLISIQENLKPLLTRLSDILSGK